MSSASKEFELQIKRINDVLVQDHADVTWNDRIPDPDNPKQPRQIDITIRRNGDLTHIECRDHKVPQGSKWIEELYGRKISLNAFAMVGVSSSGFTEGAIKKAKRLGIFLCNLSSLTDKEVQSWGKKTKVKFYYYLFSNLEITYFLKSIKGLKPKDVEQYIYSKPEYNDGLFNKIKYSFNENKNFIHPYGFKFSKIIAENVQIIGRKVKVISLRGDVDKIWFEYECPATLSFHSPNSKTSQIASVEKTNGGELEIIKSTSGFSKVDFDLSIIPPGPPNSVFAGIFQFSKLPGSKKYPPQFNVIGTQEKEVFINDAKLVIAELKQ